MPRYFREIDPKRWEKDEGNPVARAIMKRALVLVIPLVGIWMIPYEILLRSRRSRRR